MKTFWRTLGVSHSRPKYVSEVMDGLLIGAYDERYFEEDLRRTLEKRKREGTVDKLLLVDAGAKPWMMELLPGELDCVPVHLGPFHVVPSVASLFETTADMAAWLHSVEDASERRLILIVASSPSAETKSLAPVALLISCYLDFMDIYDDGGKAMDFFRKKLSDLHFFGREELKSKIEVANMLYYLDVFGTICRRGIVPNGEPLILQRIRINGGVTLPGQQRWQPIINLYTYAVVDDRQKDYHKITLGGPLDEQNATIADSFAVFNVNMLVYGDFMLHFAHWIPLIDQTQPLFSIARHTGVIQPPEHRVEVNGLEIAPGQSRGLSFDNQFTISLDFEAVSLEKDVFSEEESDIIERVVRQLDAVYDIAPQSRRAAKQRIAEAAERRAKIQTTVPTGDHHSLGLGLNQQYPQNELVEALQTLPEEDLDGLLKAFKKFQMSKQDESRNLDDVAELLAESGIAYEDVNELMIDQSVDVDDEVSVDGIHVDEDDGVREQDDDREAGDDSKDGSNSDSGSTETESDSAEESPSTAAEVNPPTNEGAESSAAVEETVEDNERIVDDFILEKLIRIAEAEKVVLTAKSVSWLDLSGKVHAALLGDSDRHLVGLYSKAYKKPVTLARKLRQLSKETLARKKDTEDFPLRDLNLPPPAPLPPEMPAILTESWDNDATELDLAAANTLVRRSSSIRVRKSTESSQVQGGVVLRRSKVSNGSGSDKKKELRQLHWSKIPDKAVNQTAFAMAAPKLELFESLQDYSEEIDQLFGSTSHVISEESTQPKIKSAGVIDPKRQMIIDIMLSKFPKDLRQVINGLEHLDPRGKMLSNEQVQALAGLVITTDELMAARQYNGTDEDLDELSRAEMFVILISRCTGWNRRVQSALVLRTYKDSITDLENSANNLASVAKQIKDSESFKSFVTVVLSVGNFLNEGTRKGDARGFRLDTLPKLAEVKSKEKNLSLLHYIIRIAEQNGPDSLSFLSALNDFRSAMKFSKEELKALIGTLKESIEALGNEVGDQLQPSGKSLESFQDEPQSSDDSDLVLAAKRYLAAKQRSESASASAAKAIAEFEEMAGYLGENPKRAKIADTFGTLDNFFRLVAKCEKELAEMKSNEDKMATT